jgi:hypothetical protein
MSERASSSMPLTAFLVREDRLSEFRLLSVIGFAAAVEQPVESGRGLASPSAACTCAESTSSSRLASMTI